MSALADLGEISKAKESKRKDNPRAHKWVNAMNRSFEMGEKQSLKTINRAEGDKRYKHLGNEVYHRNRRLFPTGGREYAAQHVKENEGAKTKVYVRTRHPNPMYGGMTYTTEKSPNAYVEGFPSWRGAPHKRLRDKGFASHEHQHVRDFAGSPKQREAFREAVRSTMAKYPKSSWLKETFVRNPQRNMHFSERWAEHVGEGEGRADVHAAKTLRTPVRGLSGYPVMADMNPSFKRGYERGGGKSGSWADVQLDRSEFNRRAKQRAKNKKARQR